MKIFKLWYWTYLYNLFLYQFDNYSDYYLLKADYIKLYKNAFYKLRGKRFTKKDALDRTRTKSK
jgi:hypothetical protein